MADYPHLTPDGEPVIPEPGVPDPAVRVGDDVLYVPSCEGDRCSHPPAYARSARVNGIHEDGTLSLTVFHPGSVAMRPRVPHDPDRRPGTWHLRAGQHCGCGTS